ncbi:MAG: hypothetical protein A2X86_18065 [Bdellovibrionales bacterium GWA2_49_15]|nr:MAG: hypothetical protein A2X86_18065 [Bdellovibrionales bacterium GWA2_49_15]
MDKIYWLYKTTHPIKNAWRDSGLEVFFDEQKKFQCQLPGGFEVKCELSLSSVGDLMSHPFLVNSGSDLYALVAETIFGADISMANLECVIYPHASGAFTFSTRSGPPLFYDSTCFNIVKGDGKRKFTFMAAACNHSLDFGLEGVSSTIQTLREEKIFFHGINEQEEDAEMATILERNGFKIGVVASTFGLNAHIPPKNRPHIVNRAPLNAKPESSDFTLIKRQIDFCHKAKADFIIAHLHWGMEHEFYPRPEQIEVAHHLIEMGIDAIIGHHSHVIQPIEYYRTRRDSNRIAPIYYSLGNLINGFAADYLCLGLIAQLALAKGVGLDGHEHTYVRGANYCQVRQVLDESKKIIFLHLSKPNAIPSGIQIPQRRKNAA